MHCIVTLFLFYFYFTVISFSFAFKCDPVLMINIDIDSVAKVTCNISLLGKHEICIIITNFNDAKGYCRSSSNGAILDCLLFYLL